MGKKPFLEQEGKSLHISIFHDTPDEEDIKRNEKEGLLFTILQSINTDTVYIEEAEDTDFTSLFQQGPFVLEPN